jgi:hypothetical protein
MGATSANVAVTAENPAVRQSNLVTFSSTGGVLMATGDGQSARRRT